ENASNGEMNGMYVRLGTQSKANMLAWGETRSEIMDRRLGGTANYQLLYINELDRTNVRTVYGFGSLRWKGMYTVIHDSNHNLNYVPTISFDSDDERDNILA